MVLEENLHTDHFKLMPDGTIRLYDHLDDLEMVASVLSEAACAGYRAFCIG